MDINTEGSSFEEENKAREYWDVTPVVTKVRKCNFCSREFESSEYRSCTKCRIKKQKILNKVDLYLGLT